MKQIKISSFFVRENGEDAKRKRAVAEEEKEPKPSCSSQTTKKRRVVKSRQKKDKENGFGKGLRAFVSASSRDQKLVLSPKKSNENVMVKSSPEKVARDLDLDFFESAFDEPMMAEEEEEEKKKEKEEEGNKWQLQKSELMLDRPIRCEILKRVLVNQPKCEQVILIRAEGSEKKAVCKLRDMWTYLDLDASDKVTVKAHEVDAEWVINAKNGYVVVNPDLSLPITSLVNGMYCLRRGVLGNLYKNINQNGKIMLFGRLIHDLFQESLRRKLGTGEELSNALEVIMETESYLKEFYLSGLKIEDVSAEASGFIPKILHFMRTYFKGEGSSTPGFTGRILEVLDIEEMVGSTKLGIQGRVDVTVKVQTGDKKRVMPLELKTGRASFSKEHKIQVIVYALLLDELIRNVDSGLLLYLRDGVMEEIRPDFGEVRNLLMLRNEFVRYMKDGEGIDSLPEPIRSTSCSKCPYSRLCLSYLRRDGLETLPANHPIKNLDFPDLKNTHSEYLITWSRMLFHECKREKDVVVMDELTLGDVTGNEFGYVHVFRGKTKKLEPGSYVTVVAPDRTVYRGKLVDITEACCRVVLGKRLKAFGDRYRICNSRFNSLQIYLDNLAYFLESDHEWLRNIIVDGELPICDDKITKGLLRDDYLEILKPLNREQQRAILKTAACKNYLLIRGPPGTGKTETIVALIKFFYLQEQRILITSHTHSSIDNILTKLEGIDYLRFGSLSNIDKSIHSRCFSRLVKDCKSMEDIKKLYERRVVASTCPGLDLDMLDKIKFDICFVDESSQVMQVEAIRPLLFCKKFVLIGDSNQLPPVVKSQRAKNLGMGVSIFERLEKEGATVSLSRQYRMNRVLNDFANKIAYDGLLECGNETVAEATLQIDLTFSKPWIGGILSGDIGKSVVFVDTSTYFDDLPCEKPGRTNKLECFIIAKLVETLIGGGARQRDIGVMSPFCDQVELIENTFRSLNIRDVETRTVDQYQGRDKDVIFLSCVKHSRSDSFSTDPSHILNDKRRLTVAVTRAKKKLVIIGDTKCLSLYAPIKNLISCLHDYQIIRLKGGENEFFWGDLH